MNCPYSFLDSIISMSKVKEHLKQVMSVCTISQRSMRCNFSTVSMSNGFVVCWLPMFKIWPKHQQKMKFVTMHFSVIFVKGTHHQVRYISHVCPPSFYQNDECMFICSLIYFIYSSEPHVPTHFEYMTIPR